VSNLVLVHFSYKYPIIFNLLHLNIKQETKLLFTLLNLMRTHGCNGSVYPYGGCPQTPRLSTSKKQGFILNAIDDSLLHSVTVL